MPQDARGECCPMIFLYGRQCMVTFGNGALPTHGKRSTLLLQQWYRASEGREATPASDAIADLAKIDRTNQIRIARKIKWLAENFEQITPLSLTGNLSSFFKLRVGDYRVIYAIAQSQNSLIIYQVGHRREIYD